MYDPIFASRRAVAMMVSGKHRGISLASGSIAELTGSELLPNRGTLIFGDERHDSTPDSTILPGRREAREQLRQAAPTQTPERSEDTPRWNVTQPSAQQKPGSDAQS